MTVNVKKTLDAIKPFQPSDKPSSTSLILLLPDQSNIMKPAEIRSLKENIENIMDIPILVENANVYILNVQPKNNFAEKDYIQSKFNEMEKRILKEIHSTKKSILYNIKKMNKIKNTILLNCTGARIDVTLDGMEKIKNDLNVTLPTATLEEFLQLEYFLKNFQDQKESLISLFRILIANNTAVKDSIAETLRSVMSKAVELQYSGTGKIIKSQGKQNFSSTNTYVCLRERETS